MRLRDEAASAYQSVFVMTGVTPESIRRAPEVFARLVAEPGAIPLRRRFLGGHRSSGYLSRAEAAASASANIHTASADLSDEELFGLHCRTPLTRLPASVIVSGDRISVKTWHAELDGSWTLELLHRLMEGCAGVPSPPWPKARSFPVMRAAWRTRAPKALLAHLAARKGRSTSFAPASEPTAAQKERRAVRLVTATFDSALIKRVRAAPVDRTTVNTRLVTAIARTVRSLYRGADDPAVMIAVHLGRWVGGPVSGNMLHSVRLGGLQSTDWQPASVQSTIDMGQSEAGFGGWLWDLQWPIKGRIRRRSVAVDVPGEVAVQISTIRSPRLFPISVWKTGSPWIKFGSVGPYPAFFSLLWRHGDEVMLALEDETDQFESERYLSTLYQELDRMIDSSTASRSSTPG